MHAVCVLLRLSSMPMLLRRTIFLTKRLSVLVWVRWQWSVRVSRNVMYEVVLELG